MSKTRLLLEYYERTKSYVLPDHIEEALENDYVRNSEMYTAHIFKCIQVLFLIAPQTSAPEILKNIRTWYIDSQYALEER